MGNKLVNKQSNLFSLKTRDFVRGLLLAILAAVLMELQNLIQGDFVFTFAAIKPALQVGLTAGIAYLIKNFFTEPDTKKADTDTL